MARRRAIGYLRVSTREQVDGFGLDVQEAAIRRYCRSESLRLVDIESDQGVSGSNGLDTRQGLATALARVERGDAAALVVYRYDRLARDLILQETVISRLEAGGASVLSVTEPAMADDDATRVLIRQVMGAFSQYEKTLIRGRMTSGRDAKKAAGGYVGGRPPYGWQAVGAELVPNPSESAVVDTVDRMRADGASYRTIAAALADAGHTTRTGGQWDPAQVRRIALRDGVPASS
jgi:DNA invertase Pin-like site-specific DNA recombinase